MLLNQSIPVSKQSSRTTSFEATDRPLRASLRSSESPGPLHVSNPFLPDPHFSGQPRNAWHQPQVQMSWMTIFSCQHSIPGQSSSIPCSPRTHTSLFLHTLFYIPCLTCARSCSCPTEPSCIARLMSPSPPDGLHPRIARESDGRIKAPRNDSIRSLHTLIDSSRHGGFCDRSSSAIAPQISYTICDLCSSLSSARMVGRIQHAYRVLE